MLGSAGWLKMLGIVPDPVNGRFLLPSAVRHPDIPTAAPVSKFYLRDGKLFDGFNHEWSGAEFEQALRTVGLLPAFREPDGEHCTCGKKLRGMQKKFCSPGCATISKRETMRRKRNFKSHQHVCRDCGRIFKVGRPAIRETD
jgi:hypothetical protein